MNFRKSQTLHEPSPETRNLRGYPRHLQDENMISLSVLDDFKKNNGSKSNERSTKLHRAVTKLAETIDTFEIERGAFHYEVALNWRVNDNMRPVNVTVTNMHDKNDTDYLADIDHGIG